MSRVQKSTVVFLILFLGACILLSVMILTVPDMSIDQFVGRNPEAARRIAVSLVDYTLPADFQEQGGRDIGVIKMAAITPGGQDLEIHARPVLLLTTIPTALGLNEEQFQQELRFSLLRSTKEVSTMEFIGEETATVGDEAITFKFYESFGANDTPTRMVFSSAFPGKRAEIMLVFAGPAAAWDQGVLSQFLTSIR